jgi:4-carboxymuconolactone decarboxylase
MPRIPLPTVETLTAEQKRVYDKVVSGPRGQLRGPLRAALYNPELADHWQALGAMLRYRTSLPPRLSELAILVTGRHCRAPFEWHAHRIEAENAGLEQTIIEAILARLLPPDMSEDDAAIYHFAHELNRTDSVSDATYSVALERFGARAVVELTALVGYYTLVAMTLNAHEIELPEGVTAAFMRPQDESR